MSKMIGIGIFGAAMFALSAGSSWYVQNYVLKKPAPVAAAPEGEAATSPTSGHASPAPPAGETGTSDPASSARLPVAVRPREMSVEELLRYGMGVKEREQQVRKQEEVLEQRRVQQQLAYADIQGERREIDGLRVQVGDQLRTAETLIARLHDARQQLQEDRTAAEEDLKKIREARVEIDVQHLDNNKRLSQWMQSMEPEKAADVLKEMANDGNIENAVRILRNFEEREAAKILSALNDPKLVNEFVDKFRNLEAPPSNPVRR